MPPLPVMVTYAMKREGLPSCSLRTEASIIGRAMLQSLLTPLRLRGVTLANRFVMAPMSRYFSPGGVPTEDVAAYYRRRAESGLGLIVTEGTAVAHPVAVDNPGSPRLHGDDAPAKEPQSAPMQMTDDQRAAAAENARREEGRRVLEGMRAAGIELAQPESEAA